MHISIVGGLLFLIISLLLSKLLMFYGLKAPVKKISKYNSCLYCNDAYLWYDCLPIFSYIKNNGRCPMCFKIEPFYYLLIRLLYVICFSSVGLFIFYFSFYKALMLSILLSILMVVSISDFTYYVILDSVLLISFVLFFLIKFLFLGYKECLFCLGCGCFLFAFVFAIKLIGDKIFGQESLGGGDIKLSFLFGFLFGIQKGILVLILGAFLAFPLAVISAIRKDREEIPFGPFLLLGACLLLLFI